AMLSLALAASGRPGDALDTAAQVDAIEAGSYLDHSRPPLASGFAFFQLAQRPEGERAFARALATVDATSDQLSQAVMRLGYGRALEGVAADEATEVRADAHRHPDTPGIEAPGWDTAFTLAARSGTAPHATASHDAN